MRIILSIAIFICTAQISGQDSAPVIQDYNIEQTISEAKKSRNRAIIAFAGGSLIALRYGSVDNKAALTSVYGTSGALFLAVTAYAVNSSRLFKRANRQKLKGM